jgi:CRP-like cAMP-binding protein
MISPEILRRYPFFGGLDHDQLVTLASSAHEESVEEDHYFFHESDPLEYLYLIVEGSAAVVIEIPTEGAHQTVADQYARQLKTTDIVISALGPGEVFSISSLMPPYTATAGTRATTPCRVAAFNAAHLRQAFEDDCRLGYLMSQKAAQALRERLQGLRMESLSQIVG